jgi:hypothetical protein
MPRPAPLLALALALAASRSGPARAEPTRPLRLAVECQGSGRTKACPAFLLGFIEHDPLFLSSPRSNADVILYYHVVQVANVDRIHLRFVGRLAGAPPVVEVDVPLDTRTDDDTQRTRLEPAFVRGVALYVGALHPEAVHIVLMPVAAAEIAIPHTTPWGFEASMGGFGSWTRQYQMVNTFGSISLSRVEATSQLWFEIGGSYGLNHQPDVMTESGETVSISSDQYHVNAGVDAEHHLDATWAIGGRASLWHDDPKGQYRTSGEAGVGIEWDRYPSDDPRGNRLALGADLSWRAERYFAYNERGERAAQYPSGTLSASAAVRKDKIGYGLSLGATAELDHPDRRYSIYATPFVEVQVGDHVDLDLSLSLTQRGLPAPVIDPTDYEMISRASYAEPRSIFGSLNLRFHWDRTNGQRNNRFDRDGGGVIVMRSG